jgi:hypothetical protein
MKRVMSFALAAALIVGAPTAVLAWGGSGHRFVGAAAMRALPADMPAFLRTKQAAVDVGEYSREPDRAKSAGHAYDSNRDPGHFLDLGDDGKVFGGPLLAALPPTRAGYETALRAVGQDSWKAGYLPYSIIEDYQQLAKDFAYWRVAKAAEANPAWKVHKAWFAADRRRREALILADIGQLSHYVGDGSQPMHVTIHFNGWGDFPNPNGYSNAKLHGPFEGALVRSSVTTAGVAAKMSPPRTLDGPIEKQVADYLASTGAQVIPFYEMEKAGGMAPGDPRGPAFATQQIAVGASELRDLITEAWRASLDETVGWKPPVPVADVIAGKTDPYAVLYSVD